MSVTKATLLLRSSRPWCVLLRCFSIACAAQDEFLCRKHSVGNGCSGEPCSSGFPELPLLVKAGLEG